MNTAVNLFHVGNCIVNLYDDRKVIVKQDMSEHHIEKKAYQLLKMLSVAPGELVDRNLLMNTITGVLRMRQTSNSLRVCGSTPFAQSIIITTLSTAVRVR